MLWLRRVVVLSLFVAMLVGGWSFARRNDPLLLVDYGIGTVEAPRWAILLGVFALGAGFVGLFALYQGARHALTTRRYRKLVRGLEEEVHQLRNLPLGPPDAASARRAPEGLGPSG
jgi:hypothetical protein